MGWQLNERALRILLSRLAPTDPDGAAEAYETLRRKLVKFFDWRGMPEAESLADETLDRLARKFEAQETSEDGSVSSLAYGIARMVVLEQTRNRKIHVAIEETAQLTAPAAMQNVLAECFEHCLSMLPLDQRELILDYYQKEKSAKIEARKELADRLGMPLNALRIRACRIRASLEECVARCAAKGGA